MQTHIPFLDLTLEGDNNTSHVVTSIYRKPDEGNTILDANSCHPKSTIHSIPTGEYINIKRATSLGTFFRWEREFPNKDIAHKIWVLMDSNTKINEKWQKKHFKLIHHTIFGFDILPHPNCPNRMPKMHTTENKHASSCPNATILWTDCWHA